MAPPPSAWRGSYSNEFLVTYQLEIKKLHVNYKNMKYFT